MTSRLKRKLGDIGVDSSSSKANESFCLIGTPLPPLEKSKDTGEFVPLWKQDVRDEQGRRRLHGAFTGGFSAGYFNTVGSKEGWTPSTFVSSRSDRAKQKSNRPEDFMDEEDLAEVREGQKLVDTNDEMDLLGGTQAELRRGVEEPEKDAITTALESSMLPPPKDSVGARILKKMGWRVGQGIGPRLTWRQRKLQDLQASTGPEVDIESILVDEDAEEASKHTYAPRDTPILVVERKDNTHGLGYRPGMGLNDSLGVGKGAEGPKGPNLSSGFGLGALNDADEDDLDVYDRSSNQTRRHMAYDASEREDDDRIVIGGKQHGGPSKPDSRSASSVQTFQDGRPVLTGFILSDKPVAEDRWFPLPEIPKGWSPNPKRVWDKNKENVENSQQSQEPPQAVPHAKWKAGISADERGTILGETPLPSAPRSVFEYISQKDREHIQNIASGASAAPAMGSGPEPGPSQRPTTIVVPRTEPHIAQAALRGFQPFPTDPVKQARYTAYLKSQASPDPERDIGFVPIGIIPGQKIDEFNKELSDYAKAATIFKPISGAMAGRFTSAAIVDSSPKVVEGLHTPSVESENARAIAESQARETDKDLEKEEETPKAHAARMGMYGRLTREVKPWQPAKLLCKRFGVKEPNPEPVADTSTPASASAGPTDPAVPDIPTFTGTESFRDPSGAGLSGRQGSSSQGRKDLSNVGLGEDEDQGRDTLTYERPAMDIFKAIFASDEEDSDGEDDEKIDEDADKPSGLASSVVPNGGKSTEAIPTSDIGISAPTPTSYEPHSNGNTSTAPEKFDVASFKPTFIPRDGKKSKDKDKGKKDKKKKSEKTIVSFDLDEDGGESLSLSIPKEKSKDRPKKKKRKEKEKGQKEGADEDETMWVEKPPAEAVKSIVAASTVNSDSMDVDAGEPATDRGRKKAIDFW